MSTFREGFEALCVTYGINLNAPLAPIEPQAIVINAIDVSPAQSPEEALAYLRSGRHIDGTAQWTTAADLDAATAKALAQRAKAGPGDDPDLFEAFSYIGDSDLAGWNGRTFADYFATQRTGSPSG